MAGQSPSAEHTAVLLLAAGASRRLGQPKQLLPLGGQPLLLRVAQQLLSPAWQLFVVLGAAADEVAPLLAPLPLQPLFHSRWAEGMGSSIAFGVEAILHKQPATATIIIAVADQPLLQAQHLQALLDLQQQGRQAAVASRYDENNWGTPCLFTANCFDRLRQLQGEQGARSIMHHFSPLPPACIDFPEGITDIDTPADWQAFSRRQAW